MMSNALCCLLLVLFPVFTNAAGVYHQSMTSSHRVLVDFELAFPGKSVSTFTYPFYANSTRMIEIPIDDFDTTFEYTITMRHSISKNVLGQMHRTMHPAQGSLNDVLSSQGITMAINSDYKCAENFYGSRCEQYCKSTSTNQLCDKNGQLQAIAPQTCSNDTCLNDGVCFANGSKHICVCAHGFEGEFCETKKNVDEAQASNYFVIMLTIFTICLILFVAICLTYRRRATRNDALQRGQTFDFPQLAKTDVVMVQQKSEKQHVFTVEENDYTTEPIYSAIHHHPKMPNFPPPMTPSWP